jgi:pimeloyl-ACP methyl ester carboxylesterase
MDQYENRQLVGLLPGFESKFEEIDGVGFHYVTGGAGKPLVLLPGWPQTWWTFHKIMPLLAQKHRVIAVDIRGMGASDKSMAGYSKKNMAKDILALMLKSGYDRVDIAGHDIGAGVAISFAGNFPEYTDKLIVIDTPRPDEHMYKLPMLPVGAPVFPWWVAFNQVRELPEDLLEGRFHLVQDWIFDQLLVDKAAISGLDRAVYARAYENREAIRASNSWYQTFMEDIRNLKTMEKIMAPTLGIGSTQGIELLKNSLPAYINNLQLQTINGSGHFIQEEQPVATAGTMLSFLDTGQ